MTSESNDLGSGAAESVSSFGTDASLWTFSTSKMEPSAAFCAIFCVASRALISLSDDLGSVAAESVSALGTVASLGALSAATFESSAGACMVFGAASLALKSFREGLGGAGPALRDILMAELAFDGDGGNGGFGFEGSAMSWSCLILSKLKNKLEKC